MRPVPFIGAVFAAVVLAVAIGLGVSIATADAAAPARAPTRPIVHAAHLSNPTTTTDAQLSADCQWLGQSGATDPPGAAYQVFSLALEDHYRCETFWGPWRNQELSKLQGLDNLLAQGNDDARVGLLHTECATVCGDHAWLETIEGETKTLADTTATAAKQEVTNGKLDELHDDLVQLHDDLTTGGVKLARGGDVDTPVFTSVTNPTDFPSGSTSAGATTGTDDAHPTYVKLSSADATDATLTDGFNAERQAVWFIAGALCVLSFGYFLYRQVAPRG